MLFEIIIFLNLLISAYLIERLGILNITIEGAFLFYNFFLSLLFFFTVPVFLIVLLLIVINTFVSFFLYYVIYQQKKHFYIIGIVFNLFIPFIITSLSLFFFHSKSGFFITLSNQKLILYTLSCFSLVCVLIVFIIMYFTKWGIILRILDQDPEILKEKNISYHVLSYLTIFFSQIFIILASAILIYTLSNYTPSLGLSKGWITLVSLYLAFSKLPLLLIISALFPLLYSFSFQLQNIINPNIALSLPYFFSFFFFIFIAFIKKRLKKPF